MIGNISKIKVGVIGCSKIARKSVINAINDSKYAEIGVIGSRDINKSIEFCNLFNCKSYGTYEDVINDDTIDLVYISLPNSLHEEWTVKAAEKRKHIWIEKPSTTSYESAKRMHKICKDNNVRLFEGFMFRYHPQQTIVKNFINEGKLGDLLKFHGVYSFPMPDKSSNLLRKDLGGGSLNDSASYPIYASRMLFEEEPISVFSNFFIDNESGVDKIVDIILSFSNGKTAIISTAFGSYYQCNYTLIGSKARLILNRAFVVPRNMNTKVMFDIDDKINSYEVESTDHFRIMIDDFCMEIKKKDNFNNYEDDLLLQARVMEAARLSFKENRRVMLNEIK